MYSVKPGKWNKGGRPLGGYKKYILPILIILILLYLGIHGIQIGDKIYYIKFF